MFLNRIKIIIIIVLFSTEVFCQPYYFFPKFFHDRGDISYGADIYRVDLNSNKVLLFISNIPEYDGIIVDPSETWAYINYGREAFLLIRSIDDSSKYFNPVINESLNGKINGFAGVIYLSLKNRFYVTWLTPDTVNGGDISETTIYDAANFKKIGDIDFGFSFTDMVSPDNEYIFQYSSDSAGNEVLDKFSTASNSVVSSIPFSDVGPAVEHKAVVSYAKGMILIAYDTSSVPSVDYRYVVYNSVTKSLYPYVYFPWRSKGYLSADGRHIILEEVDWDTTKASPEYHSGIIYVFDAVTGILNQRLTFPPGGKILLFDSYPKMFYYYNDSTYESFAVNDTAIMPVPSLVDTLRTLEHQAMNKGWIDNQGIVNGLDSKLDNAKKKLAAGDNSAAFNILNAFINEVEAQKGKHLTSEAYALLKYNAEYLIKRLK